MCFLNMFPGYLKREKICFLTSQTYSSFVFTAFAVCNLFLQEILEQNLTKLVDDDEGDSIPIPRVSSKYKVFKLGNFFFN